MPKAFTVLRCTECGATLEHNEGDPDAPLVPVLECDRECGYLVESEEGEVPGVETKQAVLLDDVVGVLRLRQSTAADYVLVGLGEAIAVIERTFGGEER